MWSIGHSLQTVLPTFTVTILLGSLALVGVRPISSDAEARKSSPRLVLEAGGHQATIRDILFTSDGRELISVSDDKTIRIWTVTPDGRQATLARTVRGEIGEGREGQMAAAALSPPHAEGQHEWLAVGGYLTGPPAERHAVRLHRYDSGEVHALLIGHTDLVLALSFSPSGRWLASASKDKTIRLWDMVSLQEPNLTREPLILHGHRDHIYDLAWNVSGDRLASASYDQTVGLWETDKLAQGKVRQLARLKGHRRPVTTLAFHPSGETLASGGKDQTIRLWRARDGKSLGTFAHASNQIAALAFAPDGKSLLAGRFGGGDKPKHITLYKYPSGTQQRVFTGHNNIVLATAFHPSGQWIASAGGDQKEILLWDRSTGEIRERLVGTGETIWAVGFAADGRSLSWGQTHNHTSNLNQGPLEFVFDLVTLQWKNDTPLPRPIVRAVDRVEDVSLSIDHVGPHDYGTRMHIRRGRKLVGTITRDTGNGYQHSAYTLSPDGRFVLTGGFNGMLELYSRNGERRAALLGHTGEIKAVAISADGRWAVSGSADQTLKLWSLGKLPATGTIDLLPTLTLFPGADKSWVAWTPQGYFAASENGKGARLIGYSINQGRDRLARYIAAEQLYDVFYRPDVVLAELHGQLLPQRDSATYHVPEVLAGGPAPAVQFLDPTSDTTVDDPVLHVRIGVIDQGGGIGDVLWKLNGITVEAYRGVTTEDKRPWPSDTDAAQDTFSLVLAKRIELGPGQNTLEIITANRHNEVKSPPYTLHITLTKPAEDKPNFYILAVGINQYQQEALQLRYAVSDAEMIATSLKRGAMPLYGTIQAQTVYDTQATWANLNAAFLDMAERVKPQDVFVLYLAGHGVTLDQQYYFLLQDVKETNREAIGRIGNAGAVAAQQGILTQKSLQNWLAQVPALKSAVLLDTCESGAFPFSPMSERQWETHRMLVQTSADRLNRATGRTIIAAATATEPALEGYKGHGIFTYALNEALQLADTGDKDGVISILEVVLYLSRRVPALSREVFKIEQLISQQTYGQDFPLVAIRPDASQ